MSDLSGRVAVVTGGSRGIGRAIADACSCAQARTVIVARDPTILQKAMRDSGSALFTYAADATDPDQARACIEDTMQRFGRIDILVNNVGGSVQEGSTIDMPVALFESTWQLNVRSAFVWTQLVWRAWMRQHGGTVLNISSLGGISLQPDMGAYNSSKAALNHLTRVLAAELGPQVRVNAIAPGLVKTDQSSSAWLDHEAAIAARMPLGRLGVAEDIAQAALFLVSEQAAWITGEVLVIDGGASVQLGRARRR